VPPAEDVAPNVVATTDEVAPGLLGLVGDVDGRQFPRQCDSPEEYSLGTKPRYGIS
jgi:hypothetical protein